MSRQYGDWVGGILFRQTLKRSFASWLCLLIVTLLRLLAASWLVWAENTLKSEEPNYFFAHTRVCTNAASNSYTMP
jgi:hypothetical protein